jgi:hypothetical protein
MIPLKERPAARTHAKDRRDAPFLDRTLEKRKKGLFFEPEGKTYRWIAARER